MPPKAKKPRVVPTVFEVFIGKKLIGWVDINTYTKGPRCGWTANSEDGVFDEGSAVSLKASVNAIVKAHSAPASLRQAE